MKKNNFKIIKIDKNNKLFNYEKKNSSQRFNSRFTAWLL